MDAKQTIGTIVDGVCPLAKMAQQRKRRFKSIDDTKIHNDLKLKHGKTVNDKWSNIVITPGTEFMEKLHNHLLNFFSKIKKSKLSKSQTQPQHIYSSYLTPGEGEHGILQHIKTHVRPNDVVVIYGLDADLIFLAMTSGIENIYLLRESLHLGIKPEQEELYDPIEDVAQELMYVSIKELKKAFNDQLFCLARKKSNVNFNFDESIDFSDDLVTICFLLGNDFLPHFPSIDISKGGLDMIIDVYIETISDTHTLLTSKVDNKLVINQIVFNFLCGKLGNREQNFFVNGIPYYENLFSRRQCSQLSIK